MGVEYRKRGSGSGNDTGSAARRKERNQTMKKTVKIQGMMCGHCEASVKKALEALPFVAGAVVSKDPGTAVLTLNGDLDEAAVKAAVEAKDFTFEGIE